MDGTTSRAGKPVRASTSIHYLSVPGSTPSSLAASYCDIPRALRWRMSRSRQPSAGGRELHAHIILSPMARMM